MLLEKNIQPFSKLQREYMIQGGILPPLWSFLKIRMKNTVSLTKNHEFRRLYRKGASAASPSMVIYCRRNGANKKSGAARTVQNRLGLTVSTKLGNAVRRNRIRRRIREVYRLNEDSLKLGNDIVIVARAAAFDMPFWKMQKDFLRLCTKLGMARRDASKQIRHNR